MPNITIKEHDFTNPGSNNSIYTNYSVLLAGFASNENVDYEGVYEFTDAKNFKNVIGFVAPNRQNSAGIDEPHYGNQMAYELLEMGYPIIYKPIKEISDLVPNEQGESIWDIFKDKANYDFRFISHGLLDSNTDATKKAYDDLFKDEIASTTTRLADIITALEKLTEIETQNDTSEARNTAYQSLIESIIAGDSSYPGLENPNYVAPTGGKSRSTTSNEAQYYSTFEEAKQKVKYEKLDLEARLANYEPTLKTSFINEANVAIAKLAAHVSVLRGASTEEEVINDGRGDCIALVEIDESLYVDDADRTKPEVTIINAANEINDKLPEKVGSYCAITVPSVVYASSKQDEEDKENKKRFEGNRKLPGGFHYLACFMNSLQQGFAEWYAAAGYTRGVSSRSVSHTTVKLGEIAINALEPRKASDAIGAAKIACNVIANFRGSYYLWGNRTAEKLRTDNLVASHFLNIRQLCTTIKKQLYVSCRRFTFDPNSDTLWVNFINSIRPTLEAMKADQGIRDYRILKVPTEEKGELKAKIRIIPIEAVEDFDLEIHLEDSFGETTAVVIE